MRIESIHIRGFGCLVDRRYEFPVDGACLILEDNERGKSTLAAAILAGLCGMPSRRVREEKIKLKDVFKPWKGDDYGLEMLIEVNGARLSVERDFAKDHFTVRDADTGKDISAKFDQDLTSQLLRLPRDDYQRVAFISGKEVARFESSTALRSRLAAVVDGSTDDSGAEAATAALAGAGVLLDDRPLKIETAQKRLTDRIAEKTGRMARLDGDLDAAEQEWRRLEELKSNRDEVQRRAEALDAEYRAARLGEAREQIGAAEETAREVRKLEIELAELEVYASFPAERGPRLSEAVARQAERESQLQQIKSSHELAGRQRDEISARLAGSVRPSSRIPAYAMLAVGGLGALSSLALMILRVVSPAASAVLTVAGVLLLAAGIVQIGRTRAAGVGAKAALAQVDSQIASLDRDAQDAQRHIDDEAQAIQSILTDAGIDPALPQADALARFAEGESRYRRFRQVRDDLLPAMKKRELPVEALARLKSEEANMAGEAAETTRASSEVESERAVLRLDLQATLDEILVLEKSIGTTVDRYRSEYSALREDVAGLRCELDRATRFGDALRLAGEVMREVAQSARRRWATELNERASRILPHLNPDYDGLLFDESLSFTVRHVPDGRVIQKNEVDACLSTGAKDQVYLAARLACCEALSALGESMPVILDDPFIAFDDDRFRSGLAYLTDHLAARQQVIILSCHKSRHEDLVDPNIHRIAV